MVVRSMQICLSAALLATQGVLAVPQYPTPTSFVSGSDNTCQYDYNIPDPDPAECPGGSPYVVVMSQWCASVSSAASYKDSYIENPTMALSTLAASYAAAYPTVSCDPNTGILNTELIMQDPLAMAAMKKRKYMAMFGSLGDLDYGDISDIYHDAIAEASRLSTVPDYVIVNSILGETHGDPIIYQGLTQFDNLAWAQMMSYYGTQLNLRNKYYPRDNIVAMAMYLYNLVHQGLCVGLDWQSCYNTCYQGGCNQNLQPPPAAASPVGY